MSDLHWKPKTLKHLIHRFKASYTTICMIKVDDIHSLTDFQRDAKSHIRNLKKSGRPTVLTINGKAAVVVQDASAYQALIDSVEQFEAAKGIQHGLDSVTRGEGKPANEVFAHIRKKHKIASA